MNDGHRSRRPVGRFPFRLSRIALFGFHGRRLIGTAACAGAVLLTWAGCSSLDTAVVQPPRIEGANLVGNTACYECHTNLVRMFAANVHARVPLRVPGTQEPAGCELCHGPGSLHVAAGGGRGRFILNPGRDPNICLDCHLDTEGEFRQPSRHPVLEGRMSCSACHDPHGMDITRPAGGPGWARLNEACAGCHGKQVRPFVFEHEALREGCLVCHEPHGSPHAALLTERGNHLCLQCHVQTPGPGVSSGRIFIGQVDHTDRLRMGTCWSAGCHTAVHGSDVHPRLLY
ncbi:cytochrome c3 family protein [Limisphaera ngatamarikiensis]|nr:cytochrome c3 family protein [Limisphaera ngatamarikiensis]